MKQLVVAFGTCFYLQSCKLEYVDDSVRGKGKTFFVTSMFLLKKHSQNYNLVDE